MAKRVFTPEQREIRRLRSAAWHTANKEHHNAICLKWMNDNKDRAASHAAKRKSEPWYKDYQATFQRKWRAENPDKVKAAQRKWSSGNPEAVCAKEHKRRAQKLASGGTHTPADLRAIWQFQNGECVYCQKSMGGDREIDHWIPLARGGSNDRTNLQYLCVYHNGRKGDKDPLEYEASIGFVRTYPVGAAFATSPQAAPQREASPQSPLA